MARHRAGRTKNFVWSRKWLEDAPTSDRGGMDVSLNFSQILVIFLGACACAGNVWLVYARFNPWDQKRGIASFTVFCLPVWFLELRCSFF